MTRVDLTRNILVRVWSLSRAGCWTWPGPPSTGDDIVSWKDMLWTALIAVAAVAVANRIPGVESLVTPSKSA